MPCQSFLYEMEPTVIRESVTIDLSFLDLDDDPPPPLDDYHPPPPPDPTTSSDCDPTTSSSDDEETESEGEELPPYTPDPNKFDEIVEKMNEIIREVCRYHGEDTDTVNEILDTNTDTDLKFNAKGFDLPPPFHVTESPLR